MVAVATIAIPTFNRLATLRVAMASALRQDYGHLRVVIYDNASTDGTAEYCESVAAADSRVAVVRHPANVGAAGNFRAALEEAEGDFFMWLADDDWLAPNYVSECTRQLALHPDAILAAPAVEYYKESRHVMHAPALALIDDDARRRVTQIFWNTSDNGLFYGLYRVAAVRDIWLDSRFGADLRFIAEVSAIGKIVACEGATLHRSLHGISTDPETLWLEIEIPRQFRTKPFAWLAWEVFRRVSLDSRSFGALSRTARVGVGVRSAGILLRRFCKPIWYEKLRSQVLTARRRSTTSGQ